MHSFLHLLFPHVCDGCGSDIISEESNLCLQCIDQLPETNFTYHRNNPVEKMFWGRLPLLAATAQYYFTKESLMQHLMHQVKYKGNKNLGRQLGRLMGQGIRQTNCFDNVEALVPLPLFPAKEKRRGYNQATILSEGIADVLNIDILSDVIARVEHTETQTRKGRMARWENMTGKFKLLSPEKIRGKHIMLIDDVVTTGATIEACGQELMNAQIKLSIGTLCYASG